MQRIFAEWGTVSSASSVRLRLDGGETVIDTTANRLSLPYLHEFSTGDLVRYTSSDGDAETQSGLTSGTDYYVLVVDEQSFKLTTAAPDVAALATGTWSAGTRSLVDATGQLLRSLDGGELIDSFANTITFTTAHGLRDGDLVTYRFDGASDTSGLTDQTDYTVLVVDATTLKLFVAPPAVVPLGGWNWPMDRPTYLSLQESFPTIAFSGIESLQGSSGEDTFVMKSTGQITGSLNGGRGVNTLDYTSQVGTITVNLASSGIVSMTGAGGVRNISDVIGGAGLNDLLVGPDGQAIWEITGSDAGRVNGINFSRFENLRGAANTQDGFIVRAGGSVSGVVDGGAAGQDGLAVEDPATAGNLAVILPNLTGSGTIAAGGIYAGVAAVTFVGMEQPFSLDTSVADQVTLRGSAFADTVSFSQVGTTLTVTETAANRFFWDFASQAFVAKTKSFTIAAAASARTFRASFDKGDIVTVTGFDPGTNTPYEFPDAGDHRISGDVFTYGGDVTVAGDSIIVDAGVTISTRDNNVFGTSVGDSGDITLTAETITINDGATLLSFDNRNATTNAATDGTPAAIKAIAYPEVLIASNNQVLPLWKPGYRFLDLATKTSGSGSGMTVDLVIDKAGEVTLLVHDAGTGYADNDEVWVEFREVSTDASITDAYTLLGLQIFGAIDWNIVVVGGNAAKVATFNVDGLLRSGGDISILAVNHEYVQGAFFTVTTNAQIDIHKNATLHGRDVSIRADANNNDVTVLIDTIEDGSLGESFQWLVDLGNSLGDSLESLVTLVSKYRPFFGVGLLDAEASVTLWEGSRIISDGSTKVSAQSDSQVLFDVISDLIGGGYAVSTSNAKVDIQKDVSIEAAHGVQLTAWSDNTIDVDVQVGGDLALGRVRGLSGTPFGIAVLVTEANSDATVSVSDGASVHAVLGDVMIVAVNTKVISATAQAKGEYKLVAASASWATGLATSHVLVDGSVTSEQGNVVAQSLTSSLGTLSDTYSQIGATLVTKLKRKRGDKIAGWFSKKSEVKSLSLRPRGGEEAASPGKYASFKNGLSQIVANANAGKYGSWLSADDGKSAEKFKKFGGSFVFGFVSHDSVATSTIGGTGVITAGLGVAVLADNVDRPEAIAAADVADGQATQEREYKETKKDYAGAFSILVASYTSKSVAEILSGATIDTNTLNSAALDSLTVQARTFIPYDFPLERYLSLADFFAKLGDVATSRNFGATTSWAKANAASSKGSVTGSFNRFSLDPTATASIGSNVAINQGASARPGDVFVKAESESQIVNFVDEPLKFIGVIKGAVGSPAGSSGGGSFERSTTSASRRRRSLREPTSGRGK